jgi:probable rRNA maturation factor
VDSEALERSALAAIHTHRLSGELCVVLTTDVEVRALNLEHRGIDETTDVLTFPAPPAAGAAGHLGDVVISVEFAREQARRRGVDLVVELAYLAIHGVLHLTGMDDETDDARRAMQIEMARIAELASLSPDPDWASIGHEHTLEPIR